MTQNKLDISRATEAVKAARFVEALSLLESNLAKDPNHIDSPSVLFKTDGAYSNSKILGLR